jgi:two-component system sensor histidine kinase/response regulator
MTTILVIEDAQTVREEIVQLLEFEGYETLAAANGIEGIEMARHHLPDLILCDVTMPTLDGYGAIEAIRREEALATTPFIFLTGRADRSDMRHGMNLGADDYITKPFTADELLTAIATRLEKHTALLQQSEQRMDELRKSIARSLPHELRTPLTQMIGFSELLMTGTENIDLDDFVESLRNINLSAIRMHRLVENFLYYSQLEEIRADPRLQRALLKESYTAHAHEVVASAAARIAEEAHRESDLVLRAEEAALNISPENLDRLIAELVDNAFKFSPEGTPVEVTTVAGGRTFVVTVVDHGRGMTPEQIARVGAYMQFDRERYEQKGCGLGLVIAQRLAELHGGYLSITSVLERGTTVRLTLPLATGSHDARSGAV